MLDVIRIALYTKNMIKTFQCRATESLFNRKPVSRFASITAIARRKLEMLDAAKRREDLRIPPDNRLELLSGDRAGQSSIRINDKWRICFEWRQSGDVGDAYRVEIVDYH